MVRETGPTKNAAISWANLIEHCPQCQRELKGHLYSLLASEVIEKGDVQSRLIEFFESLKQHDWPNVLAFQRWKGTSDNVELYGVRCGSDSVVLVAVRSPFELYDNSEILLIEPLSKSDSEGLLAVIPESVWKVID